MKAFLIAAIVFAHALVVEALWQHFQPSFTDAQVTAQGIVDTWQPHATVTALFLSLLAFAGLCVGAVAYFGGTPLRRHSGLALLSLIAAASSQLAVHIELTHRVMRVTGQTFGGLYGLF